MNDWSEFARSGVHRLGRGQFRIRHAAWPMLNAKKVLVINAFVALWMADLKIDSQRLNVGCWCVAAALAAGHRIPFCAECDCQCER
jgi:hypothetical protein